MVEIIKEKQEIEKFLKILENRGSVSNGNYLDVVKEIIEDVKINKDAALVKYTKKFDWENFTISDIEITKEELKACYDSLSDELKSVLIKSKKRIYDYHYHQKRDGFTYVGSLGETLGQKITPLESVGIYVPGGKASYPSSVLMNVMPARVAGVNNISMVTPAPNGEINPMVLAAAYICGVDHVYRIGGAQAIAALAYGTNKIKKVDKIVGPGNIFVALAKKEVYGVCGIDSIAGPSEICIISDETSNASFCAADMLGQAEHDELASAVLITTSYDKALEIKKYLNIHIQKSGRKNILEKSLRNYSKIIVVDNILEAINLANLIAPEHLEVAIDNAFEYLDKIINAGAIFLGHYSPESLGDYMAGPNHVLPTCRTARYFSPLGVDDFIKKSSIISFTKESAAKLCDDVDRFALAEGLHMHALSARIRKE